MDETKKYKSLNYQINDLIEYVTENKEIWIKKGHYNFEEHIKDISEREKAIQKLNKAKDEYCYIRARVSKGAIKENDIKRLNEAGVMGIFGYPPEMQELISKYNIDKTVLKNILAYFGSFENFRNVYKNYMINGREALKDNQRLYEKFIMIVSELYESGNIILNFDISNPNLVSSKNMDNFLNKIGFGINNDNIGNIVNEKNIDKVIRDVFNNNFLRSTNNINISEYIDILQSYFGIGDYKKTSMNDLSKEYNITKQSINNRILLIQSIINKKTVWNDSWITGNNKTKDIKNNFIEHFFANRDIFCNVNTLNKELDDNFKSELFKKLSWRIDEKDTIINSKIDINTNIEQLNLKECVISNLKDEGINTIGELFNYTIEDLREFKKIGRYSINDIVEEMKRNGYEMIESNNSKFEGLNLKKVTKKQLMVMDIYSTNDLINLTLNEIKNSNNIRETVFYDIVSKVHAKGLLFRDELEEQLNEENNVVISNTSMIKDVISDYRIKRCLSEANIYTIEDLTKCTIKDLKKLSYLGTRCIKELIYILAINGLTLADDNKSHKNNKNNENKNINRELTETVSGLKELYNEMNKKEQEYDSLKAKVDEMMSEYDKTF